MPSVKVKNVSTASHFPTRMFLTAAVAGCFMVLLISASLAKANAPCLQSYKLTNSTVVNTSDSSAHKAQDPKQPLALCNRNNQQISWLTWFFKRSESSQFHYLDLLELLSRK